MKLKNKPICDGEEMDAHVYSILNTQGPSNLSPGSCSAKKGVRVHYRAVSAPWSGQNIYREGVLLVSRVWKRWEKVTKNKMIRLTNTTRVNSSLS